jgi:hypothetical protein
MNEIIYALYNNLVGVIFFGLLIAIAVVFFWQRRRERNKGS